MGRSAGLRQHCCWDPGQAPQDVTPAGDRRAAISQLQHVVSALRKTKEPNLAKIEDARRSKSTDRPRIVGGVRWTPKELACVHVDAAAASPGRGGPSGGDTAAVVSAVNEHLAAAEHTHSTAGLRGCIANSVGYVFCSMGRTGKLTEREILAVLVHCGQRYHAGKRPFEPDLRGQEFIKMLQCT